MERPATRRDETFMRVLITLFDILDYGGIVSHVELTIRALRENGHTADLVLLRDTPRPVYKKQLKHTPECYPSQTGQYVHTLLGWHGIPIHSYHTTPQVNLYHQLCDEYDLIIHEIPNPKPTHCWRDIYATLTPQVIAAHDAHYQTAYPYIQEIATLINGISTTNHAGYNALRPFNAPRAFIGAPHVPQQWQSQPSWSRRQPQAVCAHVWKNWKHMDLVVRAANSLPPNSPIRILLAGDGIERRYMASPTKCKDRYAGIWQTLLANPIANYVGVLPTNRLARTYAHSRVMVDMSYSKKFAALGNHFNRSLIEAYNGGCVPICTDMNMRETDPPIPLFEKDETHVEVPYTISPEDLAQVIQDTIHLPQRKARKIIENGRQILLDHFDYSKVWRHYFSLANGEPAGIYSTLG